MKTKESQKKTVYCIYPSEESKGNYKKIQNVVTKKMKILVCSLIIILSNLNFGLKRKKNTRCCPKLEMSCTESVIGNQVRNIQIFKYIFVSFL